MAEVVGRAIIEILPDFTKFRAEIQQSVQSLTTDVAKQLSSPRLTQGMEQAVVKSVAKAEKELGKLGDPGIWTRLTQGSEKAADTVARAAQDGAGRAERAWKGVGDGVWTPFGQKAAAAAESVTREFSENAKQSESALSRIANSDAWAKIKANARAAAEGFESAFRESAADAERAVKGVDDTAKGLSLGKVVGGAALFGGAVAGAYALKGAIGEAITAQQESARIGRITEQVIVATGGAANLSAEQIDGLATSLSQKTGIDDEQIKSSSNVLLTFRNLQDTVGEGNDIFTRAQKAALDVSTVLGKDLNGSSIMLGKALNDPIKGMTALGRAGIQFTAEQKEQIKTLTESGDLLGAQKIILAEVEGQVGGAAAAAADPMQRLKVTTDNLKESFGAGLMPAVTVAADTLGKLGESVMPALESLGSALSGAFTPILDVVGPIASTLVESFGGLLTGLTPGLEALASAFAETFTTLGPVIAQSFGALGTALGTLLPVFTPIIGVIGNLLESLLPPLTIVITALADVLAGVLGPVFAALGPVISQIAQVLGGALTQAFTIIAPIIVNIAEMLGGALGNAITTLAPLLLQIASVLGEVFVQALTTLYPFIQQIVEILTGAFAQVIPVLIPPLMTLVEVLGGALGAVLGALLPPLGQVAAALAGALAEALTTILPPIARVAEVLGGALGTVVEALAPVLTQLAGILGDLLVGAIESLTPLFDALSPVLEVIAGVFESLAPVIAQIVTVFAELIVSILEPLRPIIPSLVEAFSAIAMALGSVLQAIVPLLPPLLDLVILLIEKIGVPVLTLLAETLALVAQAIAAIVTPVAELLAAGLGQIAEILMNLFSGDFSAAGDALASLWDTISGLFGNLGETLVGWFTTAWNFVTENAGTILTTVIGWITGIPGQILGWLGDLGGLIVGWVQGAWNWLVENGPMILETVANWYISIPGQILGWLGDLGSLVLGWVQGAWDWVVTNGPVILTGILNWITGIPGTIISTLGDIGSKLFDWARAGFQFVADKGPELISGVVDFFRSIPGRLFDALTGAIGAVGGFAADVGGRIWNSVKGFLNDKLIRPLKDKEVSAFGISLKPFGFLKELAEGGIIRVPTPAIVGEAGPEVVIPLTDPDRAKELVMQSGLIGLISGTPTPSIGAAMPAAVGAAAAMPNVGLAVTPPDTGVNPAPITEATTGAMEAVATSALGALQPVSEWFTTAPTAAAAAMAPFGATVWTASQEGFVFLRDQIFATVLTPVTNYVTNWSAVVGQILIPFGLTVWTAMAAGMAFFRAQFEGVFAGIGSYLNTWLQSIRDGFTSLPTFMSGIAQQITTALKAPFTGFASGTWNPFASALNTALKQIPATAGITIPSLPTAHSGGIIGERLPQTGGPLAPDEMVVKMQRGEGVIPADVMRDMTPGEFEAIRSGGGLMMAKPQTDAWVRVPGTGQPYGPVVPAAQGMAATGFVDASVVANLKAKVAEVQGSIRSLLAGFYMPRFLGGVTNRVVDESVKFVESKVNEQNRKAMNAIGAGDAFPGGLPVGLDAAIARVAAMRGVSGSYRALLDYIRATGVPHVVTSTVRPGARVRGSGRPSLHSMARAVDLAGPSGGRDTPEMLRIYRAFAPVRNLLAEIIYSGPGGNYFGRTGTTADDHHDHVHVGLANGGIITQPMSALLGEAGPEVVLPLTRPMRALQLAQESGLMDVLAGAAAPSPARVTAAQAVQETGPFPGVGNTYNIYGVGMEQVIAEIRAREEAAARVRTTRR